MPWNAQMYRLQSHQEQERIERRHAPAHIPEELCPCLDNIGQLADGLDIPDAVVARIGLGQLRKLAVGPVEFARVHNCTANTVAVPADDLRATVHDNVDAMLKGPEKYRRRYSIVAYHRNTVVVSNLSDLFEIHDVVLGIANAFDVKKPRIVLDRLCKILRVRRVNKRNVNTDFRKRLAKQSVCPAVKGIGRYEVPAGAADIEHRGIDRRHTRTEAEPPHAAFHRGDTFLEHIRRRIHQTSIDIAELLESKQIRRVIRVTEHVAGGLVDGYSTAESIRIHHMTGM